MKNKVVIWGTNAQNEKVLMALELKESENKVVVYVIPEPLASEAFITKLNDDWRESKAEVEFPEGHTMITRDLSVTESILPDELKADKPDIVSRAQTEWHFIVLSGKLHHAYQQELEDLKEKVNGLSDFDSGLWQSLRGFWDKVQEQSKERNLFRTHANNLRDNINELFEQMKSVRKDMESQFSAASEVVLSEINEKLADIEGRIEKGGNKMHIVFEDLKALQAKYRGAKLSNEHRNKAFERIDAAFKAAKEKRFGAGANEGSLVERHQRRLTGLLEAMKRIQDSARRDESELDFQHKKVATTEGQLEAQIRQAKIKMIEERLSSKRERIADMEKTKADIERQIKNVTEREDKRQKMESAKDAAKSEIAAVTTKSAAAPSDEEDGKNKPATQSFMDALSNVLGETLEDVVDTVKAVASVAGEKASEAFDKAREVAEDVVEIVTKDRDEAETAPAEDVVAEAAEDVVEATPEVVAEAVVDATPEVVAEATEAVVDATPEVVAEATEAVVDATPEVAVTETAAPTEEEDSKEA